MNAKHNMDEYYNRRAPEYEQIYYRDNPPRRQELLDQATLLEKLATDKSILEIACGTGYWTEIMSRTAATVVASDLSGEMIQQARQKKFTAPVEFLQADMYQLPFSTESFDMIAVGFWFSHEPIQQYERFFEMLKTYLKPGGLVWLIDNNPPAEGDVVDSTGTDEYGNNYKKRFLDNGEEFTILKNYFSENSLRKIFSPHFSVKRLDFGEYYWSADLQL